MPGGVKLEPPERTYQDQNQVYKLECCNDTNCSLSQYNNHIAHCPTNEKTIISLVQFGAAVHWGAV